MSVFPGAGDAGRKKHRGRLWHRLQSHTGGGFTSACSLIKVQAVFSDFAAFLPQDFQLEAQAVYTRAGQRLVRQRQYGAVRQLLKCVGESGTATKNDCDALILSCISVADKAPADVSGLKKTQTQSRKQTLTSFVFSIRPKNWRVSFWRPKALKTRYQLKGSWVVFPGIKATAIERTHQRPPSACRSKLTCSAASCDQLTCRR